ncbi:MAG: hypothetical protein CM1200mP35_09900 [Chloroflexota bacterium]|nr:MAG: hypothetical protein CM1200mP35_09900 [Chloroflexota bacterium]
MSERSGTYANYIRGLYIQASRSAQRYNEALSTFPSGVTHDNRYAQPFPIYMTHGSGPYKWDVDNNEYIDYVSGHGALY